MNQLSLPVSLCLATALVLGACGRAEPRGPLTGEQVFQRELCGSCHGSAGKGTWLGPPLRELTQHWEREALAEFIRDPGARLAQDERLAKLSQEFQSPMVGRAALSKAERLLLADWLLGR